jgi:SAM-dependent methyltransferase
MKISKRIRETIFQHQLIAGMDLDDPNSVYNRRRILSEKFILHKIYLEWYHEINSLLTKDDRPVLEIGSGASFINEICQSVIMSDIMFFNGIDSVLDAQFLPFKDGSLKAIAMTDVFHHLPNPTSFFREAARCVFSGGKIIMVEPWVTPWSTLVFQKFHHEPFDPAAQTWESPVENPLSGANGALPWIIFKRDRRIFEKTNPEWQIKKISIGMPFLYIASGGISTREIIPGYFFPPIQFLENLLTPLNSKIAMFACIEIQRI